MILNGRPQKRKDGIMEFIAIDLETTGTLPYVDHIVEIAGVRFNGGEVQDVFQTLVHPETAISEEVSKINGITNEMLEGKPKIEEVLEPFADFCGSVPLVAHNASFDFQFLKSVIEKYKSKAPLGDVLDTYALAKKVLPGVSNYKLGTLIQHLKIQHSTLHRAEQDAKCCGFLFRYIVEKLQTTNLKRIIQAGGRPALKFPQLASVSRQLQLSF